MRRFLPLALACLASLPAIAATVDRIAALVDRQVLTVSEVGQMATLRFFARPANQSDDDYRHAILDELISQSLRYRDVERFGAQDIPKDSIQARLLEIQGRFASPAEFAAAMSKAELTPDDVTGLIKRQLQLEAYIQERFSPMIFVSTEDIETYYKGTWSEQRKARGLTIPPLSDVQADIRALLKSSQLQTEITTWTTQLRARANVDVYAWR